MQQAPMHPLQGATGLAAKPEAIIKEEPIQELRNKFLREAYEFQEELYNFKVQSRKIQAQIQLDMDSINLNMNILSENNLPLMKNTLLSILVTLKKELAETIAGIAEDCKHSINPIHKLQHLVKNVVFYKMAKFKWASAELKANFIQRKQIIHDLSMLNKNVNAEQTAIFSPPISQNGTTVTSTPAGLLISELNKMIMEFQLSGIKSKFSKINLETSQPPTFNPPSKPVTTPVNVINCDENFNPSRGRRIRKAMKRSVQRDDSSIKKNTNILGTELARFCPVVEREMLLVLGVVTINHQCITLMEEYKDKSFEELRLTDYFRAARKGRKYSAVFALPHDQLKNIAFFYAIGRRRANASKGTSCVRFSPKFDHEGAFSSDTDRFQCITLMTEYENKSLEELRLEDYLDGRKGSNSDYKTSEFTILEQDSFFDILMPISFNDRWWRNITVKSPEVCGVESPLLQLQKKKEISDAKSRIVTGFFGKRKQGTDSVRFTPSYAEECSIDYEKYQCITLMPQFKDESMEELRIVDYIEAACEGRKYLPVFALSEQQLMKIAFFFYQSCNVDSSSRAPTKLFTGFVSNDVFVKSGVSNNIAVKYQCITFMPEYENKSLEEIRLQDYLDKLSTRAQEIQKYTQKQHSGSQRKSGGIFMPTAMQETPTQKGQASGNSPSTQPCETSTQKSQASERKPSSNWRDTPTQKGQASGNSPSAQTRETPTQKSQASEEKSSPRWRETSTQKNQAFGRDPSPQRETPTQKSQAFGRNPSPQDETPINENYEKAVQTATEALNQNPENPVYLTDRAAALLMLRKYKEALQDAQKAVAVDSTFITGYILIAKCCIKLGDIARGEQAVKRVTDMSKNKRSESTKHVTDLRKMSELGTRLQELRSNQDKARKLMDQGKYYDALDLINCCLDNYCPSCYKMKLLQAECLANNGKYQQAQDIAINILRSDVDADALYVLGLCFYKQGKDEQALLRLRQVTSHDPDHLKAAKLYKLAKNRNTSKLLDRKKEEGNRAFKNGKFEDALQLYNEALLIDKDNKAMNAMLYYNIATVYVKLDKTKEAEEACTVALHLKQDYIKALERRALCCTELGEHEDAVEDYKRLIELYKRESLPDKDIKILLRKAENTLAHFKRTNYYYKIMGVQNTASASQIRRSYIKYSLMYHPDKVSVLEKCVADRGARRFRRIKMAYDVLFDEKQRKNYDRNQKNDDDSDDSDNSD